jgi:hypothetical protein
MKVSFPSVLLLLFIGISCSEEVKPTPFEYTTVFTGQNNKTWKMKFVELAFDGEVVETSIDGCATDDEFIFYANTERALVVNTGSKKCDTNPSEPNSIVDTWSYNSATATLTLFYPPLTTEGSLSFIVREAKKNKMELEIFLNESNTAGYRIHFESTDEN